MPVPQELEDYFISESEYQQWLSSQGAVNPSLTQLIEQRTGIIPGGNQLPIPVVIPLSTDGGTRMPDNLLFDGEVTQLPGQLPGAVYPTVTATPVVAGLALPVLVPALRLLVAALLRARVVSLGVIRQLVARYGNGILGFIFPAAAIAAIIDLINGDESDDTQLKTKPKRKRRYSIGANPRLNTLLKVGKAVDNIFVRYDRRVSKFRARIRGISPRPAQRHFYHRKRR